MRREAVGRGWRVELSPLDATQHLIGPIEVDRVWRITAMTLRTFYQSGNRDLLAFGASTEASR